MSTSMSRRKRPIRSLVVKAEKVDYETVLVHIYNRVGFNAYAHSIQTIKTVKYGTNYVTHIDIGTATLVDTGKLCDNCDTPIDSHQTTGAEKLNDKVWLCAECSSEEKIWSKYD